MTLAPMTLGNMRENGVHSLAITCGAQFWTSAPFVMDAPAVDLVAMSAPSSST